LEKDTIHFFTCKLKNGGEKLNRQQFTGYVVAFIFLGLSCLTFLQGERIDNALNSIQVDAITDDDDELIGFHQNESWLVLLVDFSHDPSSESDLATAKQLIEENAIDYFEQSTGSSVQLNIIVHNEITRANHPLSYYGGDEGSKRDTSQGEFMPTILADEVVSNVANSINWEQFDINGDKVVDRLLILHSTKGQEEGLTKSSRIWSHFTYFEEPFLTDSNHKINHYTMASLRSGQNGIGTVLHEMLHQMGAADFYPEEGTEFDFWKGVGVWDIMSSGNWNDNGRTPSLPTAATMELIGSPVHNDVILEWPVQSIPPCFGQSINMDARSEGGSALKIPISDTEFIWIELRTSVGFDSSLPGEGFLVIYQDTSVGNLEENSVNQNPFSPYLKIIEADNGNDMGQGINEGESDDLFKNNTKFGSEGVEIFTHDGIRVGWTAEVIVNETKNEIRFMSSYCSEFLSVDLDDFGTVLQPSDAFIIEGTFEQPCNVTLVTNDARTTQVQIFDRKIEVYFDGEAQPEDLVKLTGDIDCQNGHIHLNHQLLYSEIIPLQRDVFKTDIKYDESTLIEIDIPLLGVGSQSFDVRIEGPLSRLTEEMYSITLDSEDNSIQLTIQPNGLLVSNMIVEGTIILELGNSKEWRYDVFLTTDSNNQFSDLFERPSIAFTIFLGFTSLVYFVSTSFAYWKDKTTDVSKKTVTPSVATLPDSVHQQINEVDAWGRVIDTHQDEFQRDNVM